MKNQPQAEITACGSYFEMSGVYFECCEFGSEEYRLDNPCEIFGNSRI